MSGDRNFRFRTPCRSSGRDRNRSRSSRKPAAAPPPPTLRLRRSMATWLAGVDPKVLVGQSQRNRLLTTVAFAFSHPATRRAFDRPAGATKTLGRVPHNFRRTAARNLIRVGVAQHVVMKLCGWKTDAMFRRYAIGDERPPRRGRQVGEGDNRGTVGARSRRGRTMTYAPLVVPQCPGRESNPHGGCPPRDFKSLASTVSPPGHADNRAQAEGGTSGPPRINGDLGPRCHPAAVGLPTGGARPAAAA